MIKANTFLAQRSLFSPLEQAQLKGFEQLKKMQEMKMQQVMAFFQQHQKGIIDYANDGLLLALGNKTNARADYTVFIKAIEDIISKEDFFGAHDNNLDYLALKRAQCEETYKALLYVTIMDETLLFLNVQEAEKFACLACSSRSMGELKGKES
jgi:LPS O-antigen subunit length determinant protein (WzzB/FepE family)